MSPPPPTGIVPLSYGTKKLYCITIYWESPLGAFSLKV